MYNIYNILFNIIIVVNFNVRINIYIYYFQLMFELIYINLKKLNMYKCNIILMLCKQFNLYF